ncbi:hypothetical protein MKQ70_32175 [Chitinophaga sedimenti]|uniref:hypothetical protein n=1 Tax=Chitinophaga sedimenti TaxID=2033606 RepID=UPI0020062E80|nr:hypothetical protein [Chitinophaga sedimenti]MCK7559376.1 hypothetical protein [Chitinophaga sedimenti]
MQQDSTHKYVSHAISRITELETGTFRGVVTNNGERLVGVLKRRQDIGYNLFVYRRGPQVVPDMASPLVLEGRTQAFVAERWMELQKNTRFNNVRRKHFSRWTGDIDMFRIGEPTQELRYFRSIIPLPSSFRSSHIFEDDIVSNDLTGHTRGLLKLTTGANVFQVYAINKKGKHYVLIDACDTMTIDAFRQACWIIHVALAFFNGRLAQGEQYLFAYTEADMKEPETSWYEELRGSVSSIYTATTANAASWIREWHKNQEPEFREKVAPVSMEMVSRLCQWISRKDAYLAVVLLIIEAKRASLLMQPAGFAIALEGMATIFEQQYPEKVTPVREKAVAREIIGKLRNILTEYEGKEGVDVSVLQKKIDVLNSPTNRDRLKIPFRLLGIPLTDNDLLALDYRNALLHGNVTLSPLEKKDFKMEELELGLRLLTLANAVVLKIIGYKGWIVNHVKTQERTIGKDIDEPYFRDIGDYTDEMVVIV